MPNNDDRPASSSQIEGPVQGQSSTEPENSQKTILGFKQNVFYLGIVSLLNDAASEIIYPLLAIFLRTVIGATYEVIGLIEGFVEGIASLMKLVSGWLSDKIKRNKVFVFVGYSLSVFMRPLVAVTGAAWQVFCFRGIDRVGKGIRTAPRDALIANSISDQERGKSFGFHRAMDHLGAVIGSLIAFVLVSLFIGYSSDTGYQIVAKNAHRLKWIFAFALVPGIASLYFVWKKVKEVTPPAIVPVDEKGSQEKLTLQGMDRRFKIFLAILALFTLGNSTNIFLLLRINEIGMSAPLVWAVFHIIKSVFSTPAGMLSDKIGRKIVIITGWVLYSVVYFGFAFTQNHNAIWILFIIYGVYYALTEGVVKALVADFAPPEKRGTAFGWYHFIVGITLIPASIIFGLFWRYIAAWFAFSFGAVLALGSAVLLILFVPGKPGQKSEEEAGQTGPESGPEMEMTEDVGNSAEGVFEEDILPPLERKIPVDPMEKNEGDGDVEEIPPM